jgi:hypothetical protein
MRIVFPYQEVGAGEPQCGSQTIRLGARVAVGRAS